MKVDPYEQLNPKQALIWRIVHINNLTEILKKGLPSRNSPIQITNYTPLGSSEIIEKRANRTVPLSLGGTLSDYVPFYFTPFSPMMYNIHTGKGVKQYSNDELIILVSSLRKIEQQNIQYVFTDRHPLCELAKYYNHLDELSKIDWQSLQYRDFKRDYQDPGKTDRYQAEALVYKHLPIDCLEAIICYTDKLKLQIDKMVSEAGVNVKVVTRSRWYF